jgi:pantoate--beta-alanine ligase
VNIARTIADVRQALDPLRPPARIGLVPTMGAFHEGHVSLFEAARRENDVVVVSLFVNPAQFGDPRDLSKYPRDEARDVQIASQHGVDLLFVPQAADMYPAGFGTWVTVTGAADDLEGSFRPGHFRGVATVCLKLFNIVRPHRAYFGQKDAQQVAVVRQMVRDLDVDLQIRVMPTIRGRDGLALSSRNVRLSGAERERALAIPRALAAGLAAHRKGADPVAAATAALGDLQPEYVAVADFDGQPTLAIAAHVGTTRLIDNVPLNPPESEWMSAHQALGAEPQRG